VLAFIAPVGGGGGGEVVIVRGLRLADTCGDFIHVHRILRLVICAGNGAQMSIKKTCICKQGYFWEFKQAVAEGLNCIDYTERKKRKRVTRLKENELKGGNSVTAR
jgi:hypothetical protein